MTETYTLEEVTETLHKIKAVLKLLNDRMTTQQNQINVLSQLYKLHEGELKCLKQDS